MESPKSIDDLGRMMLEIWNTTKVLVTEVHAAKAASYATAREVTKMRAQLADIRAHGCARGNGRTPTGEREAIKGIWKEDCGK